MKSRRQKLQVADKAQQSLLALLMGSIVAVESYPGSATTTPAKQKTVRGVQQSPEPQNIPSDSAQV